MHALVHCNELATKQQKQQELGGKNFRKNWLQVGMNQ